ncbi:hypothetical protein HMPREF1981_00605 [Bacteroides pyogenes F0041]|uniref:Uncharacterized protein n=1 Tax=Bacteroides pyogenes F0041 TaxID=1321819 RepID=U2E706_9BACE|nr:hypothetical protein HMPREF1981_00605 [Bacteroides pyogenes F0041]
MIYFNIRGSHILLFLLTSHQYSNYKKIRECFYSYLFTFSFFQ